LRYNDYLKRRRAANMGTSYSVANIPNLDGKVAVITGSSAGIGKTCAMEMARKGCHVVLACRSEAKTTPVVEQIRKETKNDKVEFMELDLASLRSVQAFVTHYKEKGYPLHILLNNAGIMACPFSLSVDGVEMQFATNHLGHFLLTTGLLDVLESSAPSRVVNVSSAGHMLTPKEGVAFDKINDEKEYNNWTAYGQSKLCNILFANELARRVKDKAIFVNSIHPGYVETELQRHFKDVYGGFGDVLGNVAYVFAKSPLNGSLTSLFVATAPEIETKDVRGQYFVPTAKLSKASAHARNEELARKLWEYSEALIQEKLGAQDGHEEVEEDDGTKGKEKHEDKEEKADKEEEKGDKEEEKEPTKETENKDEKEDQSN